METVATGKNARACGNGEKPLSVCGHMIIRIGLFHWVAISDNQYNNQEHFIEHFKTRREAEAYAYTEARREEQF